MHESRVNEEIAVRLVTFGEKTRNLKDRGLAEGASTRLLIHAAQLIVSGIGQAEACGAAISAPLTDDAEMYGALSEIVSSLF